MYFQRADIVICSTVCQTDGPKRKVIGGPALPEAMTCGNTTVLELSDAGPKTSVFVVAGRFSEASQLSGR